jgi:multiple sugar transport system permease protein/raffinose/stachyose/melibiose transport system permease protein
VTTTSTELLRRQRRRQQSINGSILISLQVLLAVIILVPFLWMFSVSIKPVNEPFSIPPRLWPRLSKTENAFFPEFRAAS